MLKSNLLSALIGAISAIVIMVFKEVFHDANKRRKTAVLLGTYIREWRRKMVCYKPLISDAAKEIGITIGEWGILNALSVSEFLKKLNIRGDSPHETILGIQNELLSRRRNYLDAMIYDLTQIPQEEYEHWNGAFNNDIEGIKDGSSFLSKDAWGLVPANSQKYLIDAYMGLETYIMAVKLIYASTRNSQLKSDRRREVVAGALAQMIAVYIGLQHAIEKIEAWSKIASDKGMTKTLWDIIRGY